MTNNPLTVSMVKAQNKQPTKLNTTLEANKQVRGITIKDLYKMSDRSITRELVEKQVLLIDQAILTAHQSGFNYIEHDLPTEFNINNMSKADAQTLIYSELVLKYKKPESEGGKGFDLTTIDIGIKSKLCIKWLNGMDNDEREERKRILCECIHRK